MFWVAPLVVFVPSFMIWVTIPLAQDLAIRNLDMGLFYIIAFAVLSIAGLVMAGWGSASKYAVLGGLRSAAQLVSYEIPIIMAVIAVAMLAQSLDLGLIVGDQRTIPYALLQPLGLFIFLIAGVAEVGRTPFDIYFAESEIVGGPFVEYSGAHWAVFFLAEYINTFVVAALAALLFLGGWAFPLMPSVAWLGFLWVGVKTYMVLAFIFWAPRDLSPPACGPAHVLRLEGVDPALLRQHRDHGHLPLLRMAVAHADPDFRSRLWRDGLRDVPQPHSTGTAHGRGAAGPRKGIPSGGGGRCWVT